MVMVHTLRQLLATRAHNFPSPHRRPGVPPHAHVAAYPELCVRSFLGAVLLCLLSEWYAFCLPQQCSSGDSSLCVLLFVDACFPNTGVLLGV